MVSPERKRSCSLLPSRSALARADVLDLGGHPELAVVLDDIAGADGIDGNFHGITGACRRVWMNGMRPRPQGRGEAGGAFYQRPPMAATGALTGPGTGQGRPASSWAKRRRSRHGPA